MIADDESQNENVGNFIDSDGSGQNVKSQRLSKEGDPKGGSGDYRNQLEDEDFDQAEHDDQVDEQPLSTHPSVLYERTPTNNFNKG